MNRQRISARRKKYLAKFNGSKIGPMIGEAANRPQRAYQGHISQTTITYSATANKDQIAGGRKVAEGLKRRVGTR